MSGKLSVYSHLSLTLILTLSLSQWGVAVGAEIAEGTVSREFTLRKYDGCQGCCLCRPSSSGLQVEHHQTSRGQRLILNSYIFNCIFAWFLQKGSLCIFLSRVGCYFENEHALFSALGVRLVKFLYIRSPLFMLINVSPFHSCF